MAGGPRPHPARAASARGGPGAETTDVAPPFRG